MIYETLACGDHECGFNTNGNCKFNAFEDIPCQDLSDSEFNELLVNLKEINDNEENE